jgi:hypothetical protein
MTWGVIVVTAVLAANVAEAQQRPAWHCYPTGGSCVAAWPGAKTPYPRSRLRRAYVFRYRVFGEPQLVAFTSLQLCDEVQYWARYEAGYSYSAVGLCHPITASQALKAVSQ